jgi:radical SAM superfamily enzyme YgiQ (UPF0313 family)
MAIERVDARTLAPESREAQFIEAEIARLFPKRSIKRALFVVPPDGDANSFSYVTCKLGRYPNFPAYGFGVLASQLRADGIAVDVLNLNNAVLGACQASKSEKEFDYTRVVLDQLTEKIKKFKPDFIGGTCMFSQTHRSAKDVCGHLRQIAPNVPLAFGGVHVTNSLLEEKTQNTFLSDMSTVDLFFVYEADIALRNFLRFLNKKAPLSDLSQVLMNGKEGQLHLTNRAMPEGKELDTIPAHDLITSPDLSKNGKIGSYHCFAKRGTRFSTVLMNRGCRARCTFCSVRNFNGLGVRGRSVQSVIDELLMLRQEHGVGHIMWLDDDFLNDHERALELFNEMIRQKVGMTWDCTNGVIAFSCTEELISAAAASGCVGLNIGMESGNPKILNQIKKPGTVKVFLKAAEVLRKQERINSRVFLMLGFPHETFSMVNDTFNVAKEMNLDWCNITPLQALPNTPIFNQMVLEGMIGTVAFDEIRYDAGAYGKNRKAAEKKVNLFATDFKDVLANADSGAIPSKPEISRLWAYMNYHLNFARLFTEKRPAKHVQMHKYLEYVADEIAPDDAFAQYFRGYLFWKTHGRIEPHLTQRLKDVVEAAPEWQDRFNDFGLSVEDLATGRFPDGDATRLNERVA